MNKTMPLGGNKNTSKAVASITAIKPARLQLNIHPDMHKLFKSVSFNNDEEMSEIILIAVADYLKANGQEVALEWLMKPSEWTK
ncbi:hypothetical protein IDQ21_004435 [Salmonella enterica]|nr:hypothetical protein [Salmonella enterica]EJM0304264.1 hypothetical protein [Salmonella enterica]